MDESDEFDGDRGETGGADRGKERSEPSIRECGRDESRRGLFEGTSIYVLRASNSQNRQIRRPREVWSGLKCDLKAYLRLPQAEARPP